MDTDLRARLEAFLRPLYQALDGVSRFDEVERVERIARAIHPGEDRELELLLLFRGLGRWLEKVGNISRTVLVVGSITETELLGVAESIRRLDAPVSDGERAAAAAALIDQSGVRGLAFRFASARREGQSILDVVRDTLADSWIPDWVPANARKWLEKRMDARRDFCRSVLDELSLTDYVRTTPAR